MLLTVAVGAGFQQAIRDKLVGMGGAVRISAVTLTATGEAVPISVDSAQIAALSRCPSATSVSPYIVKPAVLKTDSSLLAFTLKGVDERWRWAFIEGSMVSGSIPCGTSAERREQLLLSRRSADRMLLGVGDTTRVYFFDGERVRARRLLIQGIFDTGMQELDEAFALCDADVLRRINGWEGDQWSGVELGAASWEAMWRLGEEAGEALAEYNSVREEATLVRVRTVEEQEPQIVGWLRLLDQNVLIIIVLIICVAGSNLVCALLIMCLEQSPSLAILKVMGMSDGGLRRLMLLEALRVSLLGIGIGAALGVALCWLQARYRLVALDAESYYVDCVPVSLDCWTVLLVTMSALALSGVVLWLTSSIVGRLRPARALKLRG